MNQELKQTLLEICNKYNVKRVKYTSYSAPEIYMSVAANNAEIRLLAEEEVAAQEYKMSPDSKPMFPDLHIDLSILHDATGLIYREKATIFADEMLTRAVGVTMPSMDTEKLDLLDIYNAMRNKLDDQRRAETPAPDKLQDLQRAFKIQLNEKNIESR